MRVLRSIPQITFGTMKVGPFDAGSTVDLPIELAEELEKLGWVEREELVLLFFKEDVKAFVGVDGRVYGPFKRGDVANIPKENADALVEHDVVQIAT